MRTLSKTIVALGLVAFLAGPVLAQQGQGPRRGGGFGFGGGGGMALLLTNASVQQELKLDAAQIAKAKDLAEKTREKIREIHKEVNAEVNKAVREFLKPEQVRRLHQIRHQQQGAMAFTEEHVQNRLKLTDSQKADIESIVQGSMQERRSIFQSSQGDREGVRAKLAELRKATLAKVEAKLTAEQKEAYKQMLGSPFEVKWEGRAGR